MEEEMRIFNIYMKGCSVSLKVRKRQMNARRCKSLPPYLQSQNLKLFQSFFPLSFSKEIMWWQHLIQVDMGLFVVFIYFISVKMYLEVF